VFLWRRISEVTQRQRFNKFWLHREVKYDFTADQTGTGNRDEMKLQSDNVLYTG